MPRTPELMTLGPASQFLGVSVRTLRRWAKTKEGPPRRLVGKRYYYVREALKEWLRAGAIRTAGPIRPPEQRYKRPDERRVPTSPLAMINSGDRA